MCLFKYVLSIEHDGVDPTHLLEDHQHDADQQRLVDTRVLQVRQLEFRTLRGRQNNPDHQAEVPTSAVRWALRSPAHHMLPQFGCAPIQ